MGALAALTAARVASILHEPSLTGSDGGDATVANLLPEALLAVQGVIRARGYDPDDVTNGSDFDHVQAYWFGWRYFSGAEATPEHNEKAERLRAIWERWETGEARHPSPVTGSGDAQARGGRSGIVVMNRNSEPVFLRGADTRRPSEPPPVHYKESL